jgi:hypothetical protein
VTASSALAGRQFSHTSRSPIEPSEPRMADLKRSTRSTGVPSASSRAIAPAATVARYGWLLKSCACRAAAACSRAGSSPYRWRSAGASTNAIPVPISVR